jgi:lipopolysaccharide/colanic/teichoic acid biosynthesis glycosyltransferase
VIKYKIRECIMKFKMNDSFYTYQRFFDILFSTIAIVIFTPLFLVVSIILITVSGDGVIYRQKRVGLNGELFNIYKFITMIKNSEQMGTGTITLKNDSRVFYFGKFLRKTKINELPQLFNILKGDMSIIGPRPQDIISFNEFDSAEQEVIKQIKPGLSGIGSIFFRDEEEIINRVEIDKKNFYKEYLSPYKGKIEAWYVENKNISLYFILIWITIKTVLFPNYRVNYQKRFKNIPTPPMELKVLL